MSETIGVAVIGGGMAGRAHAAGYRSATTVFGTERPDVRLVAIADTNPAVADPAAYDLIAADMEWLGATPDETVVQSDRLEIYYGDARELLSRGAAYVCHCDAEEWRELKRQSVT